MDQAQLKAKLGEYDVVFLVDTSSSMGETDASTKGQTRFQQAEETVSGLARALSEIDSDGLGLVTFGGKIRSFDNVKAADVSDIFKNNQPMGSTPLTEGLVEALKLAGKSDKKDIIIVLTDGVPDNAASAEALLVKTANGQANGEDLTILFLQSGNNSQATTYLQKLDDALPGAKFDIIDAKTIDQINAFDSYLEAVAHAITD